PAVAKPRPFALLSALRSKYRLRLFKKAFPASDLQYASRSRTKLTSLGASNTTGRIFNGKSDSLSQNNGWYKCFSKQIETICPACHLTASSIFPSLINVCNSLILVRYSNPLSES